jgi:glycosyltransferase involved in cell wall biosynthesis
MDLSVIICCYNAGATLAETLEGFVGQQWDGQWEIVVSDNRSTDNSMEIVRQYQACLPNLRIVDASARQGQPYAANVGVAQALGESIAFCDADDVVAPGWVAAMGNALLEHDFVAARMDIEKLNVDWVRQSRGQPQSQGLQPYHYPEYLPHAGGGTLGCKRSLYLEMGGFDEKLPILHDTDFCWRMQRAGVQLHFVKNAMIHIRFRASLRSMYRQARGYGYYNVLLYKRYRQFGMPPLSPKRSVRGWGTLLLRLPRIRNKVQMARWVREFGWRMGRLESSVQNKIFAL